MKSRRPPMEGAARDGQSAWGSATIIPYPAQQAKQARQRLWKRIVAATRDADTEARLEAHRARIASHAARDVRT